LEVGLAQDGSLGITVAGASSYTTSLGGGSLGGLLALRNSIVEDIQTDLDSLAAAIVQQVNQYHVQGVGSAGSFTSLTGWIMTSENLADFDPAVSDGSIYIRVTNTSTGAITRNEISIDASADTLSTIATDISAITGLTATVNSSRLSITADANYEFDFLPAVLSSPTASTLSGSPPTISVSGIYTGTANDTMTFTVSGTGSVGNGTLSLVVTDAGAGAVATLNVGSGYAAGDELDLGNGIKVSLTTGDLNDSETFEVHVFADSDTSGVLAGIGLNTFFSGSGALSIAVCSDITSTPGRIATALGGDKSDNTNASRLADLREQAVSGLNSLTMGEFYRKVVTDIGQQISTKEVREDNLEVILQNLENQRSEVSGVDINEEATQMLIFEQLFQAMAKFLNTMQTAVQSLMEIV
jgi:flagellar hook-associated protein 1 FlgK